MAPVQKGDRLSASQCPRSDIEKDQIREFYMLLLLEA